MGSNIQSINQSNLFTRKILHELKRFKEYKIFSGGKYRLTEVSFIWFSISRVGIILNLNNHNSNILPLRRCLSVKDNFWIKYIEDSLEVKTWGGGLDLRFCPNPIFFRNPLTFAVPVKVRKLLFLKHQNIFYKQPHSPK